MWAKNSRLKILLQRYTLLAAEAVITQEASIGSQHLPVFCSELIVIANAYKREGHAIHPDESESRRLRMFATSLVALVIVRACAQPKSIFRSVEGYNRILTLDALKNEFIQRLRYTYALLEPRDFPVNEDVTHHREAVKDVAKFASEQGLEAKDIPQVEDLYCARAYETGRLSGYDRATHKVTESAKKYAVFKARAKKKKADVKKFNLSEPHERLAVPFLYILDTIQHDNAAEVKAYAKKEGKRMLMACLTNQPVPLNEPILRQTLKDVKLSPDPEILTIVACLYVLRPNYHWKRSPPDTLRDAASLLAGDPGGEILQHHSLPANVLTGEIHRGKGSYEDYNEEEGSPDGRVEGERRGRGGEGVLRKRQGGRGAGGRFRGGEVPRKKKARY